MLYYFLLPFLSIILIVLQNTISDIIFSGHLIVEVSIIVVIYAGFRLPLVRGAIFAFILGFVFDSLAGSVLGLFALIYVLVFLFSFFVSGKMVTEKLHFIALFTLFCALIKEFTVILLYNLMYGSDILSNTLFIFLPQAMIISLLAPVFFYILHKVEVFFYGKPAQSVKRTGTSRIPTEA